MAPYRTVANGKPVMIQSDNEVPQVSQGVTTAAARHSRREIVARRCHLAIGRSAQLLQKACTGVQVILPLAKPVCRQRRPRPPAEPALPPSAAHARALCR